MLELELMVRGLDDAAAMADLPAIKEMTFDDDEMTSQLYMLGAYLGMQILLIDNMLQDYDKGLNGRIVAIGFWDALNDESRMDDDGITEQWEEIRRILTESVPETEQVLSENHARGLAYLEENIEREGVMVTPSGLQFEVLREGDGPAPGPTDIVEVHYAGTLVTGEEFDSSYERGETIRFPVNRVIPGWTEGLQLMQVGAKYRFVIPQELAYGDSQRGPLIEPYSVLIFEVELIDVIPARVD
ncbi:peptidylprolyl isomerase [Aliidiomarina sanyensis]|uniref:Peptidyl-prolyl cis-trans isomerase n=2 Tax=Aliidiomarina sanyensis TaxID=1249555 RepID=A0A432WKG3_9GAMM|nr:peptidylprolyl isomerase [Aliidiomarina sanyensis]